MSSQEIMIKKANGELEVFDAKKLEHSLRHAGASLLLISHVVDEMEKEVEEGMSTHDIYKKSFELLHRLEKPAAARYSLRRAVMSLGPSGFPFEKFVAEIFKARGYETLIDQSVAGFCVEHELDVVAWKGNDLSMVEVKFHNELGLKCDLKVVLYVKARFEDLAKNTFTYGGVERKMTDGWLFTNTKFTSSAIRYAECQLMKIVGWNYPFGHGLRDTIEALGLFPLTLLVTLSEHDKKALLEKHVVLCKTLKEQPQLLRDLGLAEINIEEIIKEIDELIEPKKSL